MSASKAESILSDLVEIPSATTDYAANNQALDYIATFLSEREMHVKRQQYGKFGALVATTTPSKTPTVMLAAHADVVPAPDHLYKMREKQGRLYGRGVWDMKGSIAAYLAMTDELYPHLGDYDYGIKIVTDEEIGGTNIEDLIKDEYIPKMAVILDGSNNWQIESMAKGAWTTTVRVGGKAAHGSRPWEGESASFKILDLLQKIREVFKDPELPDTDTLNISRLQSGEAQNQIPESAEATIDIRVTSPQSYESISRSVIDLYEEYGQNWEVIAHFPPVIHDMQNPYIKLFASSVRTIMGHEPEPSISYGANLSAFYQNYDVPCVVTRPLGGDAHGDTEWVDKASLLLSVPILCNYVMQASRK